MLFSGLTHVITSRRCTKFIGTTTGIGIDASWCVIVGVGIDGSWRVLVGVGIDGR